MRRCLQSAMIIRFGYVAMSVHIKNASPSKTMTATSFQKLADKEAAIHKLERIAAENLQNTLRLLKHNKAEQIHIYRLSSKLIPLYTHELLNDWNPLDELEPDFRAIGDYAKINGMRLSFHPDHFTVISTPREDVLASSHKDLDMHVSMLERMGLDDRYKCNIHIGGAYGNKTVSHERFIRQFNALPERIRRRITLENDDKTFTALETLEAAEAVGVPMVLDIHHHAVNNDGERIEDLWDRIQNTWAVEKVRAKAAQRDANEADSGEEATNLLLTPKIHVSSPKSEKDPRGHADYVDVDFFMDFARVIAPQTERLDCMIEAKQKDDALFRLMKDIVTKEGVRQIDGSTVELSV